MMNADKAQEEEQVMMSMRMWGNQRFAGACLRGALLQLLPGSELLAMT